MKIHQRPSPNFAPRPDGQGVDMLVLHYTGMESADAALDRLCDPAAEVSAHYLIDEDGGIVALVAEQMRAWHAGRASWRGHSDINSRSIGIELVNPGHEFGYRAFAEPQIASLIALSLQIQARWPIPARNVVGHSDVAPSRKQDPGELFPWRRLAGQGIGLWPEAAIPHDDIGTMLRAYGYGWEDPAELPLVLTAFQRHFRPACCDGRPDAEIAALLAGLIALL
jgi:N-acetylmuramoyl-L-alanine amidase